MSARRKGGGVQQRSIGIVLIVVGLGVAAWLGVGLATGKSAGGIVLGFVLFSLPFLAVGLYFLLQSKGEIKQQTEAEKERAVLDAVTARGRVTVPDLAIDTDSSRDDVRRYIYDLIGKGLFTGYVNWEKGELVSAEAAQIKERFQQKYVDAAKLVQDGADESTYLALLEEVKFLKKEKET